MKFLYGSTPAVFESDFSLEDSITRLSNVVAGSFLETLTKQAAVGTVEASKVKLQRIIPFVQNSFKPVFFGSFSRVGNKAILSGKFTMSPFVKGFLTLWFGFSVLWTVCATTVIFLKRFYEEWWFPLAGTGMFLVGVALVSLAKWFSRNDVAWLSKVINKALSKSG